MSNEQFGPLFLANWYDVAYYDSSVNCIILFFIWKQNKNADASRTIDLISNKNKTILNLSYYILILVYMQEPCFQILVYLPYIKKVEFLLWNVFPKIGVITFFFIRKQNNDLSILST